MNAMTRLLAAPHAVRLGLALVHFLWQAALVAAVLAVTLRLMRRRSANARCLAATVALLLMAAMPLATVLVIDVPPQAAAPADAAQVTGISTAERSAALLHRERGPDRVAVIPVRPGDGSGIPGAARQAMEREDSAGPDAGRRRGQTAPWTARMLAAMRPYLPHVVGVWVVGVVLLMLWRLAGWTQVRRLVRLGAWEAPAGLRARMIELARRLGVSRPVRLLVSGIAAVPTVIGWLRPVILLPAAALAGLTPRQMEAILAHELAHIRRYDYLVNMVQVVVETLLFYHPAVWWASRRIRAEREHCCDDLAVAACGNRSTYARALAAMEELRSMPSPAVAASGGRLLDRIRRIAGLPSCDGTGRAGWLAGLLVLATLVAAGLTLYTCAVAGSDDAGGKLSATQAATVRELAARLGERDDAVRAEARSKLIAMGPAVAEAAEAIAERFKGAPGDVDALKVLEPLAADPHVQEVMLKGLDSDNPNVRHCSTIVLGKSGNREHVAAIAEALRAHPQLAAVASQALVTLGGDEAFEAMLAALKQVPPDEIWLVAEPLAEFNRPEAIAHLKESLKRFDAESLTTAPRIVRVIRSLSPEPAVSGMYSQDIEAVGSGNWRRIEAVDLGRMTSVYAEGFKPEADAEKTRTKAFEALASRQTAHLAWEAKGNGRLVALGGLQLAPLTERLPPDGDFWTAQKSLCQTKLARHVAEWNREYAAETAGPIENSRQYDFAPDDRFVGLLPDGRIVLIEAGDLAARDQRIYVRLRTMALDPLLQLVPEGAYDGTRIAAQPWPPPIERHAMAGMWLMPNGSEGSEPYHILLCLKKDGGWIRAGILGDPERSPQVRGISEGPRWHIDQPPSAEVMGATSLRLDAPTGGGGANIENIVLVTKDELALQPIATDIWPIRQYHRPSAAAAKALRQALGDKAEAELPAGSGATDAQAVQPWPPPVDPRSLAGTWLMANGTDRGMTYHLLLHLGQNGRWAQAQVHGDPKGKPEVSNITTGDMWQVLQPQVSNIDRVNTWRGGQPQPGRPFYCFTPTLLLRDLRSGKEGTSQILSGLRLVTDDELVFQSWTGNLWWVSQYVRADAETVKALGPTISDTDADGKAGHLAQVPAATLIGYLRTDWPDRPDVSGELVRRWNLPAPIAPQPIQHSRAVRSLDGRYVLFFVEDAFDGHGYPATQGLHAVLVTSDGRVLWSKALRFADWPAVANDGTVAVGEWLKDPSVVRVRMIAPDGTLLGAHGAAPNEYFLDHVRRNPGTVRSAFGTIVSQGFSPDASRFCFQTRGDYQGKPQLFCIDRAGKELWSVVLGRQYGSSPGCLTEFSPDGRYVLLADTNAAPSDGFAVVAAADGRRLLDEKQLKNEAEFTFNAGTLTVADRAGRREFKLDPAARPPEAGAEKPAPKFLGQAIDKVEVIDVEGAPATPPTLKRTVTDPQVIRRLIGCLKFKWWINPSGGENKWQVRLYSGDKLARTLWVYDYGEWGFEDGDSGTRGASDELPKVLGEILAGPADKEAARVEAMDGIAWGGIKDGLQAGLRIDEGKHLWRIGESFTVTFIVRNVADKPIEFEYAELYGLREVPAPYGLRASDAGGRYAYYHLTSMRGGARDRKAVLAPGESLALRSARITLWPTRLAGTPEPGTLLVEPGKYILAQEDVGPRLASRPDVRSSSGLLSGRIELEVLPADPDSPVARALAAQPAPTYKASETEVRTALGAMGRYVQQRLDAIGDDGSTDIWLANHRELEKVCLALAPGAVDFLGYVVTRHEDEFSRQVAAELLGLSAQDQAVPFLVKALEDRSSRVRSNAARGLEHDRSPEVMRRLAAVMKSDPDAEVRASAAFALGHIGNRAATADLLEALKVEKDPHAMEGIFAALSWLKDASVIPALNELAARDSRPELQRGIPNVIRNIKDPNFEGTVPEPGAGKADDAAWGEAVGGVARQFMTAVRDKDADAMGALIAPAPPAWTAEKMPSVIRQFHDVYKKDPESISVVQEVRVKDEFAVALVEPPSHSVDHAYVFLFMQRMPEGWRVRGMDGSHEGDPYPRDPLYLEQGLARNVARLKEHLPPPDKGATTYEIQFDTVPPFEPKTPEELLAAFNENLPQRVRTRRFVAKQAVGMIGSVVVDTPEDRDAIVRMLKESKKLKLMAVDTITADEAVGWAALRFLKAVGEKDLDAVRGACARPPEGWTARALDDLPGRSFLGWYLSNPDDARMREALVQNLRTRYAADLSRLTDVVARQVQGRFAGVYVRGPKGEGDETCLILTLQETRDGWRVLSVDETPASRPLAEELRMAVQEYLDLMRAANIAVPTGYAADEGPAWGEAVEGVQVRLRADKLEWRVGETPRLIADLRNTGSRNFSADARDVEPRELEVDGRWYSVAPSADPPALSDPGRAWIPAGRQYADLAVALDSRWRDKQTGAALEVGSGKHAIRVAFMAALMAKPDDPADGKPVRAVSNAVEIEVLPAEARPAAAAVGGLVKAELECIGLGAGDGADWRDVKRYLDFDSGAIYSDPPEARNEKERIAWRTTKGIDLWCDVRNNSDRVTLLLLGLTVAEAGQMKLEEVTLAQAQRWLEQGAVVGRFPADTGVYVFKTSQGSVGVLQLVRLDSIHEKRPRAILSYRVLQAAAPWGEAVEGVQVRLRAEKRQWKVGETPTLLLEYRNKGQKTGYFPLEQEPFVFTVHVDGQLYADDRLTSRKTPYVKLQPGTTAGPVKIVLNDTWRQAGGDGGPLSLTPGKHTVQVTFDPNRVLTIKGHAPAVSIARISNAVEIEILPPDDGVAAPPAAEQVRDRPDREDDWREDGFEEYEYGVHVFPDAEQLQFRPLVEGGLEREYAYRAGGIDDPEWLDGLRKWAAKTELDISALPAELHAKQVSGFIGLNMAVLPADNSAWDRMTIGQVVRALKDIPSQPVRVMRCAASDLPKTFLVRRWTGDPAVLQLVAATPRGWRGRIKYGRVGWCLNVLGQALDGKEAPKAIAPSVLAAIRILSEVEDARAVPVLEQLAEHADADIRKAAEEALAKIKPPAWGEAVEGVEVGIEPQAKRFVVGQAMPVKWTIRNTSDKDVAILWHPLHFSPVFFEITGPDGKTRFLDDSRRCDIERSPAPPERIVLRPGESKSETLDLSKFLGQTPAGKYRLVGLYDPVKGAANKEYLAKPEFKDVLTKRVTSAAVEIEIVPAEIGKVRFGIYRVTEPADTQKAEATPIDQLKTEAEPLLSDRDILRYDWTTHTMYVRPEARQRLSDLAQMPLPDRIIHAPALVVVDGRPVYLLSLQTLMSSYTGRGPSISLSPYGPPDDLPETAVRISPPRPEEGGDARGDDRIRKALSALGVLEFGGWGEAVEGVQVRLRAEKTLWNAGETPRLLADVRNQGRRDLVAWPGDFELEVDGKTYRMIEVGAPGLGLSPGKQYDAIGLALNENWGGTAGHGALTLAPGKHMVRVTFVCQPNEKEAIEPAPQPVRAVSNAVEIETLPAEAKAPDGAEADKQLPGSKLALEEAIAGGCAFIAVCEAEDEVGLVDGDTGVHEYATSYQKLRVVEVLVGQQPAGGVRGFHYSARKPYDAAAGLPGLDERDIRKGERVIWIVRQVGERFRGVKALADTPENRAAVAKLAAPAAPPAGYTALVKGLSVSVTCEKPEVDLATDLVLKVTVENKSGKDVELDHVGREAGFPMVVFRLTSVLDKLEILSTKESAWCGTGVTRQTLKNGEKKSATIRLGDLWRWYGGRPMLPPGKHELEASVRRTTSDGRSDILAASQALTVQVAEWPWGEQSEGVQIRLQPDFREMPAVMGFGWLAGQTPRFLAEVHNSGQRRLTVVRAQQLCEVEIDGQWYRWAGEVDAKASSFGPGRRYLDMAVALEPHWQNKRTGKPLELAAGSHRVRVAFTATPAEGDGGRPVRAVSNPVDFFMEPDRAAAPPAAPEADPKGAVFMGLYLLDAPPMGGIVPDLWQKDASGSYELRVGLLVWRREEPPMAADVYYVPDKDVFYVRYNPDGQDAPPYYGPFKGKPWVILGFPEAEMKAIPPWSEPVEGVRMRLWTRTKWMPGEMPSFEVDVFNLGRRNLQLVHADSSWELECDGTWYRASGWPRVVDRKEVRLDSRGCQLLLRVPYDAKGQWHRKDTNELLALKAGRHTIRMAVKLTGNEEQNEQPIRAVSTAVEIEILPAEAVDVRPAAGDRTAREAKARIEAGKPPVARPADAEARERFLAIERFARLPTGEQAAELPRFYRDLAPRYMSPIFEMSLSSYRQNILDRGAGFANPGGDHTARWAGQIAEAAATMTPEQVADRVGDRLWLGIAARARALWVLKAHPEATEALIRADLKSGEKAAVNRATTTITSLKLQSFTDELLAMFVADDETSEPARLALLWLRDPAIVRPLLKQIEKNPKFLIRCSGLFQGPLQGKPAEPLLVKLLDSADDEVRYHAAYALFECRDPQLGQPAVKLARERESRFRWAAAQLAGNLPDETFAAVRKDLLPLLADADDKVRFYAMYRFAGRKDPAAGPVILEALNRGPEALAEQHKTWVMQSMAALGNSTWKYDSHHWGPDVPGNREAIRNFEAWLKARERPGEPAAGPVDPAGPDAAPMPEEGPANVARH